MIGQVFCDYLNVTVPQDEFQGLMGEVEPILHEVGCEMPNEGYYESPLGGMVKTGKRSGVAWVMASGGMMATLRAGRLLNDYLMAFGVRPHRVTRLDATLDLAEDAPPILERLYGFARSGELRLSRKRLGPGQFNKIMSPSLVDGRDTGTLYLGLKTAEVRLKVYDKREERYKFTGQDPGPLTRYEVTATSKVGVTLRDVVRPEPLFYHFMAPQILSVEGVEAWEPREGGYVLERAERLPGEALKRRVWSSHEVGRLCDLARQCGPHGLELLLSQIRRRYGEGSRSVLASS